MLEIHGNDIYISRGEAGTLNVSIYCDNEIFTMGEGDRLRLRVFSLPGFSTVLEKESPLGQSAFELTEEDSEKLDGALAYSVSLLFADGRKAVIIGPGPTYVPRFNILEA